MEKIFSQNDIENFAKESNDFNPLHCDYQYARKTMYGECVVYGVSGILECLKTVKKPICFLEATFFKPLFCKIPYQVSENGILDGDVKISKLKLKFSESECESIKSGITTPHSSQNLQAKDMCIKDILTKKEFVGEYVSNSDNKSLLANLLMWSSWFVGMEVPGKQALYSKIKINLKNDGGFGWSKPFSYKVNIQDYHEKYNLLSMSFECFANGNIIADGILEAFIRPKINQNFYQKNTMPHELQGKFVGKTALITGASRGFGAALSQVMAAMGAHVIINFNNSMEEAQNLQRAIENQGGSAELWQCDVSKMQNENRSIDILALNAAPPTLALKLALHNSSRIEQYLSKAFSYALIPLSIFADTINKNNGYCLIVSSEYLDSIEQDFPHYLCSKAAVEMLGVYASKQFNKTKYVTIRPPKMLTDMSNSVAGNINSVDPIIIAEQACLKLLGEMN